jgi:hypothetical protein
MTNVALSYHCKSLAIQQSHITAMTQLSSEANPVSTSEPHGQIHLPTVFEIQNTTELYTSFQPTRMFIFWNIDIGPHY